MVRICRDTLLGFFEGFLIVFPGVQWFRVSGRFFEDALRDMSKRAWTSAQKFPGLVLASFFY